MPLPFWHHLPTMAGYYIKRRQDGFIAVVFPEAVADNLISAFRNEHAVERRREPITDRRHLRVAVLLADRGDFDATATTIALSVSGQQADLPRHELEETFERYWRNFLTRRDGGTNWNDYTPYELRTVGSFVRLGWRARAWPSRLTNSACEDLRGDAPTHSRRRASTSVASKCASAISRARRQCLS
jgi:hypothetical protein